MLNKVIFALFTIGALVGISCSAFVGSSSIYAPAVVLANNTGSLTIINLTVTTGNGIVNVTGPAIVGNNTVQSAQSAAAYAASYLGLNESKYDFAYYLPDQYVNVSGPSAGAAMTLLAISSLSHAKLASNFTITGTINPDGTIGEIGGVYDKAGAAKFHNLNFILVPAVPESSFENELYYLTQSNFDIPLVQVSNITQALNFATNKTAVTSADKTNYSLYTRYNTTDLNEANISCSNNCNESAFNELLNYTFGITKSEISTVGFNNSVQAQLYEQLNQSRQIGADGYLYTAADIAFLDYVNAFMFSNHNTSRYTGALEIHNIMQYCSNLSSPQLTTSNYEFVIGGQLRQMWGEYTIGTVNSTYNVQTLDSDEVLNELYLAGQADGWCSASGEMYGIASRINNSEYVSESGLENLVLMRLDRASAYGSGLYFSTAEEAYNNSNYAAAIIDSDYAYAFGYAAQSSASMTNSEMLSSAASMASNATYGVWGTEFAKESTFYIQQSELTSNITLAHTYAEEAYSTALLASQISNDTRAINSSFVIVSHPTTTITTTVVATTTIPARPEQQYNQRAIELLNIYMNRLMLLVAIILAINVAVLLFVIKILLTLSSDKKKIAKKQNGRKRRTRR